jgi:ribosome maturation factor RimP
MDLAEEIRKMAESKLANGQFIVDVMASSRQGPGKILVIVDGDQGVGIDDCAEISRHLSKTLDDAGVIRDQYTLEVSTPGVDHPLKMKRQYFKNIGRGLRVKLQDSVVEGKLAEVHEDKVVLAQEVGSGKNKETKTVEVPFAEIEKAFVLVSFK